MSGIVGIVVATPIAFQDVTAHDMLDASMFWVGLLMALTPLVIIGSVVGFVLWQRRSARRRRESDAAGGDVKL